MPLFHWTQVALLCAVAFVLGVMGAHWLRLRRRPAPPVPETGSVPARSHETPALRVLEDQFRSGRLGFDECLELASTYRRQGDIQAAIEIHQSLYGRPGLKWQDLQRAQYELASDFYHAGILGRSEDLLRSLVSQQGPHQMDGVRLLLRIYQQEQDWDRATQLFHQHPMLADGDLRLQYVHILCEQAEQLMRRDTRQAIALADKASRHDPGSLRPKLIRLRVALQERTWKDFRTVLSDWLNRAPERSDLLLPVLTDLAVHWPARRRNLLRMLQPLHDQTEIRLMMARLYWTMDDPEEAMRRIRTVPLTASTLRWRLEYLARREGNGDLSELVTLLHNQLDQLPQYRCTNCGFEAKAHHWHCPQCDHWETMTPGTSATRRVLI